MSGDENKNAYNLYSLFRHGRAVRTLPISFARCAAMADLFIQAVQQALENKERGARQAGAAAGAATAAALNATAPLSTGAPSGRLAVRKRDAQTRNALSVRGQLPSRRETHTQEREARVCREPELVSLDDNAESDESDELIDLVGGPGLASESAPGARLLEVGTAEGRAVPRRVGGQKSARELGSMFGSESESEADMGVSESVPVPRSKHSAKRPRTKKARVSEAPRAPMEPTETRGTRYRSFPSKSMLDRFSRAFQHRLFLVERTADSEGGCVFAVLGSNGNIYNITIDLESTCTCPDYQKRHAPDGKQRGPCKHLIFVLHRVLKVPKTDHRWWQTRLLPSELSSILANSPADPLNQEDIVANRAVREQYKRVVGESQEQVVNGSQVRVSLRQPVGGDCPICFEVMDGSPSTTDPASFCTSCGNNFHLSCFEQWRSARVNATCPLCRANLEPDPANEHGKDAAGSQGYLNLAEYSTNHSTALRLDQLYEDTHEYIGRRRRGLRGGRGIRGGRSGRGGRGSGHSFGSGHMSGYGY